MPPKKNKNKKKNSLLPAATNGDTDAVSTSVPETPLDEKQEFVTPLDRPENPLDEATTNGSAVKEDAIDEKAAMAKADGDDSTAAWGLDGDVEKKTLVEEPEDIKDPIKASDPLDDLPEEFKPRDLDAELAAAQAKENDDLEKPIEPEVDAVAPVAPVEEEPAAKVAEVEPKVDSPAVKPVEEPEEVTEKVVPPVDLDIPDTADSREPLSEKDDKEPLVAARDEEPVPEKPETEEPVVTVADPEDVKEAVAEAVAEPVVDPDAPLEAPVEVTDAPVDEPAVEEAPLPAKRDILPPPNTPTLESLLSSDRDFTSTRYQSSTSPQFLNKPHQPANHSLDLDDRNMQSSLINWYKKVHSFSESINWRPGWEYLEEYDQFIKSTDAALSQVSLHAANEYWAEKPFDPTVSWDNLAENDLKYENFWDWKSNIALSAILSNFACREVFGKTVFALDDKSTRKLGLAMTVFSKDFGDDITATKFRHMTLKLLKESESFKRTTRRQTVLLSQELANILSPLSTKLPPTTEEEGQKQAPYSPLVMALYEKVLSATLTLHDTIQKDYKYYALFHPVPGGEFDDNIMEETTFDGLGAGSGSVALVARPGLVRLGLPKGGEPEDIVIVHKALVVREGALEEALKYFENAEAPPAAEEEPAPPAEIDA